ncbi:AAA family ATPase [Actinorugispora endophytica]|uniref:AAA domain-containing protein n=1 Tax=Actinorugispora endophytica TaxID=1605990 RepID=A0A4R6V1J0_9ACTN|nr:AAA family ATPase [Actinorugispora endophytica]TDQ52441.1 AAA domain-containing protein [Actinorugispora endophytica]
MTTTLPPRLAPDTHPPGEHVLRYPRRSVVLLGGIPGAGKSTMLNRLYGLSGNETETVRTADGVRVVDSLQSRNRLTRWLGSTAYPAWRWVTHLLHYLRVLAALRRGGPVVVHETGTRGPVRRLLGLCSRLTGVELHVLLIDVDPLDARRGQAERGRMITAHSFRTHERRWRALLDACSRDPERVLPGARSLMVLDRSQAARVGRIEFGADHGGSPTGPARPWAYPG